MFSRFTRTVHLGIIHPRHISPIAFPSTTISQLNQKQSNIAREEKSETGLEEEPELGVNKLFPCDVLQAHWVAEILAACPKWITSAQVIAQQIRFDTPLEYCKPLLYFLRNHTHAYFQQMDVLATVDHIGEPLRFELSYCLRNVMYWNNIRYYLFFILYFH